MRLVTVAFESGETFLAHYSDAYPHGAVFCRTRARLTLREPVVVELAFPGLPNRALLRGTAVSLKEGDGAWVRFAESDHPATAFVVRCARGELVPDDAVERTHRRFPAELPVDCRVDELDEVHPELMRSRTRDLGAGGAFIVSNTPPPVGTRVNLTIGPDAVTGQRFSIDGRVAWIGWLRRGEEARGFGVKFDAKGDHDTARLRLLLRRAAETGRIW
jgi:Tfp pilus assembly protein PilZ